MALFLILGGTGKVGRRLGTRLASLGHTARVASRSSGDVRFDWHDASTYADAVRDVEGIFIVGPGSATDWSALLARLLAAAVDAGVRRVVLLSARGVEFLPDGVVARAEQTLAAGGIPWTILRPTHFAQNFSEAMFVPEHGRIHAPVGEARHPFIDVRDIADVAASILVEAGWEGEIVELSGPRALGFGEAAAVLARARGEQVEYVTDDRDAHVRRLRESGAPDTYITWRMAMLDGIAGGRDEYLSDGVDRVLGRGATTFERWAQEELAPEARASTMAAAAGR
ncbi:NAD(P)H-binding protein [Agromyces sp. Soil535]|uniref:NAD(P)H-binding protein n=1 Tax=Agromyces sp. Soil535 TaxID=1736390 RepID=UPI0006FAAEF5|nr:NAD(P)H-binding protein [Agromyces sp. Soil535]KRE22481.1 hypothetical protein ASG80_11300 [Agromyces sp. Soil535]